MIILLFIIGVILLLAINLIPMVFIDGVTLILAFGDFIVVIIAIALIVKIIKRIRH